MDGDGTVAVGDLLAVIGNWSVCGDGTFRPTGDVNGDCCVNVSDVLEIVNQWGTECVITGACCLSDFSCSELSENACAKVGGIYFGDESLCADTNCPVPRHQ